MVNTKDSKMNPKKSANSDADNTSAKQASPKQAPKASPWKHFFFWLLITALVAGGYYRLNKMKEKHEAVKKRLFVHGGDVMGTYFKVSFYEEDKAKSEAVAKEIERIFNEVNDRFSNYSDSSEMSKLNLLAGQEPFKCSDEMWQMIQHAKEAYEYTDKAFDVTAGPLVDLWGFFKKKELKTLPEQKLIEEAINDGIEISSWIPF